MNIKKNQFALSCQKDTNAFWVQDKLLPLANMTVCPSAGDFFEAYAC